jgi:hypothetical protein
MAVPGSAGELQSPRFVCDTCGALFHHVPEACPVCAGKVSPRSGTAPTLDARVERRRQRILYAFVAGWILLLAAFVAHTALDDPSKGHAGRNVYPSELALQNFRHGGPADPVNTARIFRLTRSDRIEKVGGPPEAVASDVWIRVTSGPHAGRTGVIVW